MRIDQFRKSNKISIKDLLISRNKIYVSYTHEIEKDCWNTSLIFGEINYTNIVFKELFSSPQCIHSTKNIDKEFEMHQSGGKVIPFDENNSSYQEYLEWLELGNTPDPAD